MFLPPWQKNNKKTLALDEERPVTRSGVRQRSTTCKIIKSLSGLVRGNYHQPGEVKGAKEDMEWRNEEIKYQELAATLGQE